MDKKQYILTLLNNLLDTWAPAAWLKELVESWAFDDAGIDVLIQTFKDAIKKTKDETQKTKLQQSVQFLEKLKETEIKEQEQDAKDIEALDKLIAEI